MGWTQVTLESNEHYFSDPPYFNPFNIKASFLKYLIYTIKNFE
jgi:hypothetical protein